MNEALFNESVILLHGLGRTRFSMRRIQRNLESTGFSTHNCGYPSTRLSIEQLADRFVATAVDELKRRNAARIHVVTHSLGGILMRSYLHNHALPEGSRIVMLSPPNQGSEVVDFLQEFRCFGWLLGPSALQLGTGSESFPNRLGRIACQTGIIAGSVSSDPWFSWLFPGAHDGKVSVQRARLEGMTDFLVVPCGHTRIMQSPIILVQIQNFLRYGHFLR